MNNTLNAIQAQATSIRVAHEKNAGRTTFPVWEPITKPTPEGFPRRICSTHKNGKRLNCKTFGGYAFFGKNCAKLTPHCHEYQPRPEGEEY